MSGTITKFDEIKFIYKLAEQDCFNSALSFKQVIQLIIDKTILLEIENDQSKIVIDKENIELIEKTMPLLLKIADKPKSFITLHEEKVPVETAKRINHKAIMKLSRDSNDWHARTLLSIKPKNVAADINEETFNIYENRFVITLVDKIDRLLKDSKIQYLLKKKSFEQDRISEKMKEYFHTSDNFSLINKINKTKTYVDDTAEIIGEIDSIIDKIDLLERKIRIFVSSKLYQSLRKCRRVKNPIMKTNILMFSPEYNAAYKLWNNLIAPQEEPTIEIPEEHDSSKAFVLYTLLNILSALYEMGFQETLGSTFSWNNSKSLLTFSREMVFKNAIDTIKLNYIDNCFILNLKTQEKPLEKWKTVNIYTNYIDFEEKQKYEIEEITTDLLNSLVVSKKEKSWEETIGQFCVISTELIRRDENSQLNNKLYKRFYSLGDNYSDEENKENIAKWGNHKTGLVNITPVSLKLNLLRMKRLLNTLIIPNRMRMDRECHILRCPICGEKHIKELDSTRANGHEAYSYICKNCQHIFSYNYCSSCGNEIYWVKYSDEKFLDNEEVISGDFTKKSRLSQLSDLEVVSGTHSITGFVLEKERSGYKLKTLCPKCGKQLGHS